MIVAKKNLLNYDIGEIFTHKVKLYAQNFYHTFLVRNISEFSHVPFRWTDKQYIICYRAWRVATATSFRKIIAAIKFRCKGQRRR